MADESPAPTADSRGDADARDEEFSLFYTDDMPRLVAFLMVQGAPAASAAETAQDAMTEAYRQWDSIDTPRAWVRVVASRAWWRQRIRSRQEGPLDTERATTLVLTTDEAAEIDARHEFLTLIRSLPDGQRQVMAWTYDGYRPTEIAALLGKDPATVRSALRTARATLRDTYHRLHGGRPR